MDLYHENWKFRYKFLCCCLKEDENKVSNLFNSLNLGNNYANQIERVRGLKSLSDSNKISPIQVTVKNDGLAEIAKAAKCLKDNHKFKSFCINPDLTEEQQVF